MGHAVSHSDGHAIVAAIRVLEVRNKRPPTVEEMAELLGWHAEQVGVRTRALEAADIVRPVESAFDVRYEILDHQKLEQLPQEAQGMDFKAEMDAFEQRSNQDRERLEEMFEDQSKARPGRKADESLGKEFSKYRKNKPLDPFGDD